MGHARDITGVPQLLGRPSRATRARLVAIALLAFALRALIPLGFMPASDGSLSLMICPGGLAAGLLQGQGHAMGQSIGQQIGTRDGSGLGKSMAPSMGNGMPMSDGTPTPAHQHDGGHGLMDEGYCAFTTGFSSAPPPLLPVAVFLLLSCVAVIAVTVAPFKVTGNVSSRFVVPAHCA